MILVDKKQDVSTGVNDGCPRLSNQSFCLYNPRIPPYVHAAVITENHRHL